MNIDFSNSPGFSAYVVLLLVSGIVMLVLAAVNSSGQTVGWRIFNALVGAAFFGYGVYLAFIFTGGSYLILYKVFILPVVLIVNFFRSLSTRSRRTDAAAPRMYRAQQQYDAAAPYTAYTSPQAPTAQPQVPPQATPYQPTQQPVMPQSVMPQPPVPQAPQG